MVQLCIKTGGSQRGPGYWKFNNTLLHDKCFVDKTNNIIEVAKQKYKDANPADRWEMCKNDVTDWTIDRSKEISKNRKEKFSNLMKIINKEHIKRFPKQEELKIAQMELDALIAIQVRSAQFRSKAEWHEASDANKKRFFNIEKSRYNKKAMRMLHTESGDIISDPGEILNEQRKFYKNLYQKDSNVSFRLVNDTNHKISSDDKESLDQEITFEEITQTVRSLKKNKTPGIDGWNCELMQFFWSKLGTLYFEAMQWAIVTKNLHVSAKRGIVLLIPKKDRDPLELKGWRPLTMLSVCYKILAKTLARRIKPVLNELISECQTGFLEKRQISETIRTTIDISTLGKKAKGYILSIDFEKCFDKIAYEAITGSLKYFNFGPKFIEYVELLLYDFKSCTSNNGFFSEYFDVTRSCHQGCNLAPYLFLVCLQLMFTELK